MIINVELEGFMTKVNSNTLSIVAQANRGVYLDISANSFENRTKRISVLGEECLVRCEIDTAADNVPGSIGRTVWIATLLGSKGAAIVSVVSPGARLPSG